MSKKCSAHKTFNTNFECHEMFYLHYKLINLARDCFFFLLVRRILSARLLYSLTLVSLKKQFNSFFNYNKSASVKDHLNSSKKNACFLALAYYNPGHFCKKKT